MATYTASSKAVYTGIYGTSNTITGNHVVYYSYPTAFEIQTGSTATVTVAAGATLGVFYGGPASAGIGPGLQLDPATSHLQVVNYGKLLSVCPGTSLAEIRIRVLPDGTHL